MRTYITLLVLLITTAISSQTIKGKITRITGEALPFATVSIKGTTIGTTADENGLYELESNKENIVLVAEFLGFFKRTKSLSLKPEVNTVNFVMKEYANTLDQVTVTGTRTDKRKTNSAVIVNVINSATLENVQACNLAEGLKFQSGLRVETDCQTCNYTQLRMNGLSGGYSQILINGRPVFSPLTGLYGLEQIPTNMIERIEVVRGGGSALFGSSAVGGTVNVITKIPKKNNYSIGYTHLDIDGTSDDIIAGNATIVNEDRNAGASFFINNRARDFYDANGDNYSELPKLKNTSFGTNIFFKPTDDQKVEINFSKMNEYRYGGEMVEGAAHFSMQCEERVHDVYVGNVDYQINFNENRSSLITYFATQYTGRVHYTGIRPEKGTPEYTGHLANPPYGTSETTTYQGGLQFNHKIEDFLQGDNVFTVGAEFVQDDVFDVIPAYNYKVDQLTKNTGFFFQSDWKITDKVNLLTGVRLDKHNLLDKVIASPRVSVLAKPFENTQIRATFGTGFRAPQSFDTDMHIAFAGGGVSRITLSPDLKEERSKSYNISINYDKPTEHYIYGFTAEAFYTQLTDAFTQVDNGTDVYGNLFEKQNGDGATVQGVTLEARLNYDGILQVDAGLTLQSSEFEKAVENSADLDPKKEFLRTPNTYGFSTLTYTPNQKFKTALNFIYTGKMDVMHAAAEGNLVKDEYIESPVFTEVGIKSSYKFTLEKMKTKIEVFAGVKNIFDAYQESFDKFKERDSNFVYGPATPRTLFVGIKFGN